MPPCAFTYSSEVKVNSKMRSHSHSADIEQKLKSIISTKPNSSTLLQKVLLTQQKQNNLYTSSNSVNITPSSININNNEYSQTSIHVNCSKDDEVKNLQDSCHATLDGEKEKGEIKLSSNESENKDEGALIAKPISKLPLPVISTTKSSSEIYIPSPISSTASSTSKIYIPSPILSSATSSSQVYIPSPIYSPSHTITKPSTKDNDNSISISDLSMEDSAKVCNDDLNKALISVQVNCSEDEETNRFPDLQITSDCPRTSVSQIDNQTSIDQPGKCAKYETDNESLTVKPASKLPLPVISTTLSSSQVYIPSPIYSPSQTTTKRQAKETDCTVSVSNITNEINVKVYNKTNDLTEKDTPRTIVNTIPKLYSMIANNAGRPVKLERPPLMKTSLTDKHNIEKAILNSSLFSQSSNSAMNMTPSLQQTDQETKTESPSTLHDIHIPIVTLVDSNFKYAGESISVDTFNDNLKNLSQNNNTQTLLLALPENFNVSQFSNQTLNLDAQSQEILRSLLMEPTVISLDSNENKPDNVSENDGVLCVDETSDAPSKNNTGSEHLAIGDLPVEKLSDEKTNHSVLRLNSIDPKDKTTLNSSSIDSPKEQSNVDSISENINISQDNNSNPLPVATINVDMIDGQPMYTIQIMGQNIPLAAITIPTSDGPLYLQSATSTVPLSQLSSASNQLNEANCTYTVANEDSSTMTTTKEGSTCSTIKPKYTCQICGKSYIRSWSYYGHLRLHSGEIKRHTCAICKESFAFPSDLKDHMMIHSAEERGLKTKSSRKSQINGQLPSDKNTFACSIPNCDKVLGNASALKIHQRVHQEEKPYKCTFDGCNKAFKTPSELSRHQFRHTGEKPFKCDQCDKAFVRNDDLKRHYFIHTGQKRFHCDQCDFSCIQSFDLVKHKYIHGGEKPYKCKSCSKQFTRPARLREHERLHTGERPYTCDICGKSFTQLTSLKSHKLAHIQKPIPCEKCDKMFTNTLELQDHMNTHLGTKPFQCPLCNKMFVSEKTLKRHAVVHTGEKPYKCKVCHKLFARSSDLKVHMPVHEENKPYKCDICPKMFTRYSSLKEHLRLHTGELPFSCDVCDKVFNHRSHLNVHMWTHTGEKPHKCTFCPKEFSRKANLNLHLRVHSAEINNIDNVGQDDDNISDSSIIGDHDSVSLDSVNVSLLIQNALKRKREESLDSNDEFLSSKRHMTEDGIVEYTEQVLSNLARDQPHLQVGEVTVVDTSSLSSILQGENQVIVTQLSTDQLTPLADNLMNTDYGTVVALGLGTEQTDTENLVVENLIQLNRFDNVQELNGHGFAQAEEIQSIDEEQITEWQHEEE